MSILKTNHNRHIIFGQGHKIERSKFPLLITAIFWTIFFSASAQQVADTSWSPPETFHPRYEKGKGPLIFIDEAHYNFHTKDGRYLPFAILLEKDGYQVRGYSSEFKSSELISGKILVVANALNKINETNWVLPTPSAFTPAEIENLKKWVSEGGRLFLIADHMPFAGAAADLAKAFGFEFTNGFALDTLTPGPSVFTLNDGTLLENEITNGKDTSEKIHRVVTFTGQAFRIPSEAKPVIIFNRNFVNFLPDTAWVFNSKTPVQSITGWSQGAFRNFGKGRVVVFGEAAMFTAQLAGPTRIPVGMNSPDAPENYKLLLNIIHWLD